MSAEHHDDRASLAVRFDDGFDDCAEIRRYEDIG
jgi:hypothetical protein